MVRPTISLHRFFVLFLLLSLAAVGCNKSSQYDDHGTKGSNNGKDDEGVEEAPFEAPELSELDKTAEWEDMPVVDSIELRQQLQAKEGPAPITVKEALALKNTTGNDSNRQIIATLGRLAEDDADINYDAKIVRHTSGDIKSTNPLMGSSSAEFDVLDLTSFGLFGFDWNMKAFASKDSVASWQSSKDRLYDKVVLRDDLFWSDGTPVTAYDVEFSYHTIMNPKVPVPAVRSGTDQLLSVVAYDKHTVVFFHKNSLATNQWNINFPVIPKHVYKDSLADDYTMQKTDYHVEKENNPVTCGAYKISKRQRGSHIILSRNESYYMVDGKQVRPKPYFKEIRFEIITDTNTSLLALKSGRIEESILTAEQWVTQTGTEEFYKLNTKAKDTEWVSFHFCWNTQTRFFGDKRVRTAMSYAFDHKEMIDTLFYGLYEQANGTFHRTSWMAPENPPAPYHQDLDKAEALLAEAGWEDHDGDGILDKEISGKTVPFEFTIVCSTTPISQKVCELLRESLDRIGVICNIKPTEFTVLQQLNRDHKFEASYGGWGTGTDPDTSENIWTTKAITQGRNYGQYSNPEVDKLYEEGRREFDFEKRKKIYARIHEILYEDQPYTWLYYRDAFYGFNKKLRGYKFSPRGPYSYGPGFGSIWVPRDLP